MALSTLWYLNETYVVQKKRPISICDSPCVRAQSTRVTLCDETRWFHKTATAARK